VNTTSSVDAINQAVDDGSLRVFALPEGQPLGPATASAMGCSLTSIEVRRFDCGEYKVRPLDAVRGADVYVVASLVAGPAASLSDQILKLLFFVATLKDARAARVTVVAPYFCYSRKDRRTKARDPVTLQYVARLFETVGTDALVTVDVHNAAAYQNAFRISAEHLTAAPALIDAVLQDYGDDAMAVVAPDTGGAKRAEAFRKRLEMRLSEGVPLVFLEKERTEGIVRGGQVVGSVDGRTTVVVDDLISSGRTLAQTATACRARGARRVVAAVTHGVFAPGCEDTLRHGDLENLYVSNSITSPNAPVGPVAEAIHRVDLAPILADAIVRLHANRSLLPLTDVYPAEREARRMKADEAGDELYGDAVQDRDAGRNR